LLGFSVVIYPGRAVFPFSRQQHSMRILMYHPTDQTFLTNFVPSLLVVNVV
jgi:hypothetical protein